MCGDPLGVWISGKDPLLVAIGAVLRLLARDRLAARISCEDPLLVRGRGVFGLVQVVQAPRLVWIVARSSAAGTTGCSVCCGCTGDPLGVRISCEEPLLFGADEA